MIYFEPPHEVKDAAKFQQMVETLENGGKLPPVVVCGQDAFTGSHRIAAWVRCDMDVEAVEMSQAEYIKTMAKLNGVDDIDPDDPDDLKFFYQYLNDEILDYNEFCQALSQITKNIAIAEAVKDQL